MRPAEEFGDGETERLALGQGDVDAGHGVDSGAAAAVVDRAAEHLFPEPIDFEGPRRSGGRPGRWRWRAKVGRR